MKKNKIELVLNLILPIIMVGLVYLAISFIYLEFNCFLWTEEQRAVQVIFGVVGIIIGLAMVGIIVVYIEKFKL